MTLLGQAVLSRWLTAARTIRIDKALIRRVVDQELAPQVKNWLKRLPHQDQPIGTNGDRSIAEAEFYIDSVDGSEQLKIDCLVIPDNFKNNLVPVVRGTAGRRRWVKGEAVVQVVLYINATMTPSDYLSSNSEGVKDLKQFKTDRFQPLTSCTSEQCVPYGLYSVLIHEVTHAAEIAFVKDLDYEYDSHSQKVDDSGAYFNDPREVRAYMQQVVDEALRYAAQLHAHKKGRSLVDMCLKLSSTWKALKDQLKPTNRNKILSAVYDAFKSEGYLE